MADESNSEINKQLAEAANDPENFDFGFEDLREDTGYANFGFDPEEAERLRLEEINEKPL